MAKKQILNLVEMGESIVQENGGAKLDKDGFAVTERRFMVDSIKNSIDFKAGQKISEFKVRDLLSNSAFEVNVRRSRNSDFS
jgi:hypothetical protein